MRLLARLGWSFLMLFRRPVLFLIPASIAPKKLDDLGLDPQRPVCYVLPGPGLTERVLLQHICREQGLPVPSLYHWHMPEPGQSGIVCLPSASGIKTLKEDAPLRAMSSNATSSDDYDVQLVPVSVFWSRDPGKETSLFKIIFSDSVGAGRIRKLFIILFNGRNTFVNFGQPVALREFVAQESSADLAVHKLVRVLRVHFSRQRTATLGPSLSSRSQLSSAVLGSDMVKHAIDEEEKEEEISHSEAVQRAQDYFEEIAADYSNAFISFADRVLGWLWNRIYDGVEVYHAERLREYARDYGVVYLPAHRSHLDYMLLSYILYHQGLVPPHIAAGINLNFWPMGALLRKGGAFYIRRSFGGNKLYTAVFRAYVDMLLARGYSLQFFPEGGRSRTGRLLKPKTGMMSMVVQSSLRNPDIPIVLVPVYIGYDKVWEVGSYYGELSGDAAGKKKKESIFGFIGALRILRMAFGKTYISFGDPMSLRKYLDEKQSDWRKARDEEGHDLKPDWLPPLVTELSNEIMTRINNAAVLNAAGLCAAAVLATPQKAMANDELCEQLEHILEILRAVPHHEDVVLPEGSGQDILTTAEHTLNLSHIPHAWGEVLALEGRTAVLSTYQRNGILHLLALPALLASHFLTRVNIARTELIDSCIALYPFLGSELFLPVATDKALKKRLDVLITVFLNEGLLVKSGRSLERPDVASVEFASLIGLGQTIRETLERYCLTTVLLAEYTETGSVRRSVFEEHCQLMAERLAILNGRNAPEFFDKSLFRNYLDGLIALGYIKTDHSEEGEVLIPDALLRPTADRAMSLLGAEVQLRIRRLTKRRKLYALAEQQPEPETA